MGIRGGAAEPRLVITHPAELRNHTLALADGQQVLGRAPDCDLYLAHPHVSSRHATLTRSGAQVVISDLSSTNGTYVNDRRVRAPQPLRCGDLVRFGDVCARYDDPSQSVTQTAVAPVFDIRSQQAGNINNVARDQHIHEARQSFLKEVAATRSRGRRLLLLGFLLSVGGFGLFAWGILRFMGDVGKGFETSGDPWNSASFPSFDDLGDVWGDQVGGIPLFLFGWVAAAIGSILMIIGFVLHIVAAARRRAIERTTYLV